MMIERQSRSLLREIALIITLSVVVALVYNHFSMKGIPLIRTDAEKVGIADSVLFRSSSVTDTVPLHDKPDSVLAKEIIVNAPLHQQALRARDSAIRKNPEVAKPVYRIISLSQLQRLMNEHRGILIDARNSDEYIRGHIRGARNIPALDTDRHIDELVMIPRDTLMIIYCNGPACDLGHVLADFLSVLEFTNLVIYENGWEGWTDAKMPVDTSNVN
jgi:rhodanese-related sulfurtransferase